MYGKVALNRSNEVFVERPNVMRPAIVEGYIKSVMAQSQKSWIKIIERIYTLNLDNRILNNLRQQLNEMIEDEKGIVAVDVFRKMFFTFFKGERHAY